MLKKRTGIATSLIIVISLLLVIFSCAKPAPAPAPAAPTPAPAPAPAPAPKPAPVILKAGTWVTPTGPMGKGIDWYLTEVEKRSEGAIKFERYWTESLAPSKELLEALRTGIADVAHLYPSYYPGKLPLGMVGMLGFFMADDVWTVNTAWGELYATVPALQKEMAAYNTRFLAPFGSASYYVFSTKQIKSIADLKGLKIHATGYGATLMKELGAVPTTIAAPEIYTALERGTIDAAVWTFSGAADWKIDELVKSVYLVPSGGGLMALGIRDAAWAKLSPDLQKIMADVAKEYPKAYHQIYQIDGEGWGADKMKQAGAVFTTPTAEDLKVVNEAVRKVIMSKWVADSVAAGQPGGLVFDTFASLIEKYKPLNPFKK